MATQREIPAILKLYDLLVWTMNHTARFPRHHRYSLGIAMENRLQTILTLLCCDADHPGKVTALHAQRKCLRHACGLPIVSAPRE